MPGTDYYKVLGVAKTASDDDIKKVSAVLRRRSTWLLQCTFSRGSHADNACVCDRRTASWR
jgi:hypothetical protein